MEKFKARAKAILAKTLEYLVTLIAIILVLGFVGCCYYLDHVRFVIR